MAVGGVILAGGRGRRLGGDKALRLLAGRPLLSWVAAAARPQVDWLILNASAPADRFAALWAGGPAEPVVPDDLPDHAGPLAGVAAALAWAGQHRPQEARLASFPCDTPWFPDDLVVRLGRALDAAPAAGLAYAVLKDQPQPLLALWRCTGAPELRRYLAVEGGRRVDSWLVRAGAVGVRFAFPAWNLNRPEELAAAEAWWVAERGGQGS